MFRDPGLDAADVLFAFLWRDLDLEPAPVSELPLSRYMGSPYGWMIARTGWEQESVIAEMKVNVYNFTNHQHLDAGAFQIFYKGPLALDSGMYQGVTGGYGSPHDINYNKRTIAHNCLLVYDPAETFVYHTQAIRNDGGQQFPNHADEPKSLDDVLANYRTGEVLAQGFGPDPKRPAYTYLKGDLTRSYGSKVRQVERSFVFLNLGGQPVQAAMVVFDRVVSADPKFRKVWLLHSMEEPQIDGNTLILAPQQRGWRGKLVTQVLLPEKADIAAVGGPGREFWVFGENFPNGPAQGRGKPERYEIGRWRSRSLTVQGGRNRSLPPRDAGHGPRRRSPARQADRGGRACRRARRRHERLLRADSRRGDRPTTIRSEGSRFLVTDLSEGTWHVSRRRRGRHSRSGLRAGRRPVVGRPAGALQAFAVGAAYNHHLLRQQRRHRRSVVGCASA